MQIQKLQDIMRDKNAGRSKTGMRKIDNFLSATSIRIKKDSAVPNTAGKRLIDLEMVFPFNPLNPNDGTYTVDDAFHAPTSPTTFATYLKSEMAKNPALHEFYAEMGNMKVAEYKLDLTQITALDWKVFTRFRRVLHYSLPVNDYTFTAWGPIKRTFLNTTKKDENGKVIELGIGDKLRPLEVSLAASRVTTIEAEYEEGGIKYGKPETEKKEDIKKAWQGIRVSNTYLAGTMRELVFDTNSEFELQDKKETIEKNGLVKYARWTSGGKDNVLKYEGFIGTKIDKSFDYLEFDISYPEVLDKTDKGAKALASYERRTFRDNPTDRINTVIPGFDEMYMKYRDTTAYFDEIIMINSVKKYAIPDDSKIMEAYKQDLGEKKIYIDMQIAQNYSQLIAQIDGTLSEELIEKIMDEKLTVNNVSTSMIDMVNASTMISEVGVGSVEDEEEEEMKISITQ